MTVQIHLHYDRKHKIRSIVTDTQQQRKRRISSSLDTASTPIHARLNPAPVQTKSPALHRINQESGQSSITKRLGRTRKVLVNPCCPQSDNSVRMNPVNVGHSNEYSHEKIHQKGSRGNPSKDESNRKRENRSQGTLKYDPMNSAGSSNTVFKGFRVCSTAVLHSLHPHPLLLHHSLTENIVSL
ncbi:uncharacterized protein VTP21DRAFT_8893 [Calcarisporiella thermophila]|uniref:uncharacterized protein n=1 Tax=Calcarisporiella thermophila TaxID=911321 RepID=UPI003742BEAB